MAISEMYGFSVFIINMHANVHEFIRSSLVVGIFWNSINLVIFSTFLFYLYDYQSSKSTREESIYDSLRKVSSSPVHVLS
jgi:hypothetical protein